MVQAQVASQTYQLRDAGGKALNLSRLDTYLRLFALDLLPQKDPATLKKGQRQTQIHFIATMRLRADLGDYTRDWRRNPSFHGREGGLNPSFELLYTYLSITDLAGIIDMKIGRQFQMEPLDLYGFDGLHARFRLPFHLTIETIGGLRNGGRWGVDAPIFLSDSPDLDGTRRGWRPLVGAAVETRGLPWLRARLSYRASWHVIDPANPGSMYPTEPGEEIPKSQLSEEKITAYVHSRFWKNRLHAHGGLRYNLLTSRIDEMRFGVGARFGKLGQLAVTYAMEHPDFDGDSIFNIFNTEPYQEVRLTYEHRFNAKWRAYARGTVRLFTGGDPEAPESTERRKVEPDGGGGLGATFTAKRLAARLDLYWQEGYGGRTLGVYGYVRWVVLPRWLSLTGRVVVAHWDDELSTTPKGVTAGLALGGRITLGRHVGLHIVLEDNFGTHHKADLRLFALLNVSWCSRGSCAAGNLGVP